MKILVVSNYYPPQHIGGYELGCRDVVTALRQRGHDVRVLTSNYGRGAHTDGVRRELREASAWGETGFYRNIARLIAKEWTNQRAFSRQVAAFRPDLVYFWNPTHISISLAAQAQALGLPVAYFVSDHWLASFAPLADGWFRLWLRREQRPSARIAKPMLRRALAAFGVITTPPDWTYGQVQFASRYLKDEALQAGKPVEQARVIHWGIDPARFTCKTPSRAVTRLLYAGQVSPHKGVHTALAALALLRDSGHAVTLDIVGGSRDPQYVTELQRRSAELGLSAAVHFRGALPREQLAGVYASADVLIFPSVWSEPFSITLLEAMVSGLPVVATGTGGSAELLTPGVNALVFAPDDAQACAQQVLRLIGEPDLYARLRLTAHQMVVERFSIGAMVDEIETSLASILRRAQEQQAGAAIAAVAAR